MDYCFTKRLDLPFEEAVRTATEQLRQHGFGVLTEIDVKATLKKKLGVEYPNYRILGACNPPNAHKALGAEPNVGVMLPCNVVVYEQDDHTVLSIIRPTAAMAPIGNDELKPIAERIEGQLKAVFDSVH